MSASMVRRGAASGYANRRISRACDSCYARKIKCDAVESQCDYCRHHGLLCTYIRTRVGNGLPRRQRDNLRESYNRSNFLAISDDSGSNNGRLVHSQVRRDSAKLLSGVNLRRVTTFDSTPLIFETGSDFTTFCAGEFVSSLNFSLNKLPWQARYIQNDTPLTSPPNIQLPDRSVTEDCVSDFCASFIRLVFPVIDVRLFKNTIELAYSQSTATARTENAIARHCVYSLLCMVSLFEVNNKLSPETNIRSCMDKTQSYIPHFIREATIDALQTLIILCLFYLFSGDIQSAAMLNSLSSRMLFQFKAHVSTAPERPTGLDRRRHLRDLFWLCYTFDKEISLRLGQPPAIDDDHCDLTLPPGYEEMQKSGDYHDRHFPEEYMPPLFPWDIRLSFIKSRAYDMLYSSKGVQKKTKADLVRDVRALDDDLETWRKSLRPQLRPRLDVPHAPPVMSGQTTQSIMLNLAYYHCLAMIHRAISRCYNAMSPPNPGGQMDGLRLSLAVSVTASRSSLNYLRSTLHSIAVHCFWIVLFYPMPAILTIFCNVVLYPTDVGAMDDLQSLWQVPELFKGIQICKLIKAETLQFDMAEAFVKELVRLGTCAINHE
ncbi:hypothetical protein EV356DRAFT_365272 [Viridothelium virens]|uniref:Zn(2)-C6 fungal-type domain-containing protein n=1 Tax=Viridothelium virens TaxID=1048519 RepID=A0A6A6GVS7_VIRVR|nr:hypothetical protein EV356DRAFT_365272 [Viridothelium virens]